MKEKFRNIFWFFGIFAIVVMLCTFDMDYQELWQNPQVTDIEEKIS